MPRVDILPVVRFNIFAQKKGKRKKKKTQHMEKIVIRLDFVIQNHEIGT